MRTPVVGAHQFKLSSAGATSAHSNQRSVAAVGDSVKALATGRLLAIKLSAIPAGIANRLHRFRALRFVGNERGFHNGCNEKHQWHPTNCGPYHEKRFFHKCCLFATNFQKSVAQKTSLCQPISVRNLLLNPLIVSWLQSKRASRRSLPSRSLAFGSVKLAVPTCTAEAPTTK